MFTLLANTYTQFVDLFSTIEFNGRSILVWGLVPFILGLFLRFIFPLFGHRLESGNLTSDLSERDKKTAREWKSRFGMD